MGSPGVGDALCPQALCSTADTKTRETVGKWTSADAPTGGAVAASSRLCSFGLCCANGILPAPSGGLVLDVGPIRKGLGRIAGVDRRTDTCFCLFFCTPKSTTWAAGGRILANKAKFCAENGFGLLESWGTEEKPLA